MSPKSTLNNHQYADLMMRIETINADYRRLMEECVIHGGATPSLFIDKGIPQSELFMTELIPYIHRYYLSAPTNAQKTVLDIGPQSFGGTRLLHSIHNDATYSKLKLEITAIDIVDSFEILQKLIVPDIEFLLQDIFAVRDRVWDFLICSHVVEHVPDPFPFMQRAQELARDFVLMACPWEEDPITTISHVNTIDQSFVDRAGAENLCVYTNYMWGKHRKVCIFTLPGRGPK